MMEWFGGVYFEIATGGCGALLMQIFGIDIHEFRFRAGLVCFSDLAARRMDLLDFCDDSAMYFFVGPALLLLGLMIVINKHTNVILSQILFQSIYRKRKGRVLKDNNTGRMIAIRVEW